MLFKMAAKAVLFAGLVLIGLASYPALLSAAESIEFFPPKNLEAGLGFLYFDAGGLGNKSVYAVPVQSEKLITAVEKQTLAIMEQTEAIKNAQEKSAWQCNWSISGSPATGTVMGYGCVNPTTGASCLCLHVPSCNCP